MVPFGLARILFTADACDELGTHRLSQWAWTLWVIQVGHCSPLRPHYPLPTSFRYPVVFPERRRLCGGARRCALVYMNDCLVHSLTLEQHLLDVEEVLEIFCRRKLELQVRVWATRAQIRLIRERWSRAGNGRRRNYAPRSDFSLGSQLPSSLHRGACHGCSLGADCAG